MDPGGQIDLQQLLSAAAQMQSQLVNAQQQLAETEIEGTSGGGLVKVIINGQGEIVDLTIGKDAIDPGDPEETASTVADLVLAACRDAYDSLADAQEDAMGPLAGAFGGGGFGGAGAAPGGLPGFPGFPASGEPPVAGKVEPGDAGSGDADSGQPG